MAKAIDWTWIKRQFSTGQLSNVQIGKLHEETWGVSVSESAIRKREKAEGWKRNLAPDVRAEFNSRMVREGCEDRTSDREVVEQAAERAVQVVRGHRDDIQKSRNTLASLRKLADEKLGAMNQRQSLAKTLNEENSELLPADAIASDELQRVSATVANMTAALKNLVYLERQAFSIDPKGVQAPQAVSGVDDEAGEQLVMAAAQIIEQRRN